jgi:multiple antibiotic resistance protein
VDLLYFTAAVFAALFAIVNPMGAIPLLVGLTEGYTAEEKKRVVTKSVFTGFFVLMVFALLGNYIFAFFGITIPAFRIAGGLLMTTVGFSMMRGQPPRTKSTPEEREEAVDRDDIGVVPLGVPMLAGPGSITTVMIFVSKSENVSQIGSVLFVILAIMLITYFLFIYGDRIFDRIGRVGSRAFSRIMGLIITAIAVEFILEGIHDVLIIWGIPLL